MRLERDNTDLFLRTVPIFVRCLPPAPSWNEMTIDKARLNLQTSVIELRFEITRLRETFTSDYAMYDIPLEDYQGASSVFEDVLNLLDDLVDEAILNQINGPSLGDFSKLKTLAKIITECQLPQNLGDGCESPNHVEKWIRYAKPGKPEAVQYRLSTREAQRFNYAMDGLFSSQVLNLDTQVNQVFHRDRLDGTHGLEAEQRAFAEIYATKKIADATKAIAGHISKPACQNPHTVLLHLNGFQEPEIDTIITVCRPKTNKWHAVRWIASPGRAVSSDILQEPTTTICENVTKSRPPKIRLRIEVYPGGSWKRLDPVSTDRMANYAIPPKTVLQDLMIAGAVELWKRDRLDLSVKIVRSLLCLIGTPFLQGPWTSERILCSQASDTGLRDDKPNKLYLSEEISAECARISATGVANKSFILDLGVLLWELFSARKVEVAEDDEESDDESDSLFNALNREETTLRHTCVGDNVAWLDIIANCLNAYGENELDNEKLRANLYMTIFVPLQDYLKSYQKPSGMRNTSSGRIRPQVSEASGLRKWQKIDTRTNAYKSEHIMSVLKAHENGAAGTTESYSWLERFDHANKHLLSLTGCQRPYPVKIAILDTGCDVDDLYFSGPGIDYADDLMDRWHDFLGESTYPVDEDEGRHGTALTCSLLRISPGAVIYVIRVARDSSGLSEAKEVIAKAILHAVQKWDVDIVSMSFGFSDEVNSIGDAITKAERIKEGKILFFAAANNNGLNEPELFPALFESVIAVRGTAHDGSFISQYCPKTWGHASGVQCGTLARNVPCGWMDQRLTKSGCSVATPILAAIAAALISFVECESGSLDQRDLIRTRRGIMSVFKFMADGQSARDQMLYLAPWQLFENNRSPKFLIGHALAEIPRKFKSAN